MPVTNTDIKYRLTTTAGTAGDTTASTPAASLGKYASTTAASSNVISDMSAADNAASVVDYWPLYVLNDHASLTLTAAVIWLSAETAGGSNIAIAVDNIAASAKGASAAQGAQIASRTTAPTGVGAYSAPTTQGTALALGDLPAGYGRMVWLRRTGTNSAAIADGVTLSVTGETNA